MTPRLICSASTALSYKDAQKYVQCTPVLFLPGIYRFVVSPLITAFVQKVACYYYYIIKLAVFFLYIIIEINFIFN